AFNTSGEGHEAMPEPRPSEQVHRTVALVYQPLRPLGRAGLTPAVIVGAVRSTVTVRLSNTLSEPATTTPPAVSTARTRNVCEPPESGRVTAPAGRSPTAPPRPPW